MALILIMIAGIALSLSYQLYARRIDKDIFVPSPGRPTPARRYRDGVDYEPAHPWSMFGFQYKSITIDPIIGPVIAVQFGWLPAILWLLLGSILIGWVQDYVTCMMSLRHRGLSLGNIAGQLVSPRARRQLFALFYIYLLLIMGGFGAIMFPVLARENVPVGFLILILTGLLFGEMAYRRSLNLITSSLLAILLIILAIYTTNLPWVKNIIHTINTIANSIGGGVILSRPLGYGDVTGSTILWTLVILGYCYLGAVLPVRRFAHPVNYTAFLFLGLFTLLSILGMIIATLTSSVNTTFEIPPLVTLSHPNLGPLWPILFVTISTGAISGWNALLSSFSSSRQIERETHALPVTAGAHFFTTITVVLVIIFAVTLGVTSGRYNPNEQFALIAGPAGVFANGMMQFLHAIGIPMESGESISVLFVIVAALTVLHLVLRFMRETSTELWGETIPIFKNVHFSTILAVTITFILILFGFWPWIWVLFGSANQLLASFALLLVSVWLTRQGKPFAWTLFPAIFMFITSMAALTYVVVYRALYLQVLAREEINLGQTIGNFITAVIGIYLLSIGISLFTDGIRAWKSAFTNTKNTLTSVDESG